MKNKNARIMIPVSVMMLFCLLSSDSHSIHDRYTAWRNPPSPDVVELADKTGMSELGRRIFFASRPSIDNAETLNANCSELETTMIIMGCYSKGQIHVFNVLDERIADAEYVASAHEMLHAAYLRLSKNKRDAIDKLLDAAYLNMDKNGELLEIMAEYAYVEPTQRYNELHSILGTEYDGLPPELEEYYARYFNNRRAIVDMAAKYRRVFKQLETEQAFLKAQIDRLLVEITNDSSYLENMIFWLNRDVEIFNKKNFQSLSEFNSGKEILLERETEVNSFKARVDADIDRYNKLVEEFNSVGGKIEYLNNQLDSRPQPGVRVIRDAR